MAINTVEQMQSTLEVWKNTSLGPRWVVVFDLQGRETTRVISGETTFTITTFERQINQERAATPELDLFRDGTFVLVKGSKETQVSEVESPQSMTDAELVQFVNDVVYADGTVKERIVLLNERLDLIESPVTLQRMFEAFAMNDDTPTSITAVVKKKMALKQGSPQEREIVTVPTGG